MKIINIDAYEILASGGFPTLEVKVTLEDGSTGTASVPYGASAGSHEATVIVDEDQSRYKGQGMMFAVNTVRQIIAPKIALIDAYDQRKIDETMNALDGSPNKANLGGNSILAVSLSVAKAAAQSQKKELYEYIKDYYKTGADFKNLPSPMIVSIEGGKHADHSTDLQEFCITAIGEDTVKEKIRKALEAYHALKSILKKANYSTNVGNEGAFAPNGLVSNEQPLQLIMEAIEKSGYKAGIDLGISIDAANNEIYQDGLYHLKLENKSLSSLEIIEYFKNWFEKYPIVSVEDLLAEDDWDNWPLINQAAQNKNILNIGDDLTVTNIERLQKAIDTKSISAILIKLNQIGTLTETVDCCMLAKANGLATVPSHRGGGETNDTAMIDLAVAVGAKFVKVGPTRGERVAKYNRLMEIERQLS